jgi:hypothetical protein
MSTFTCLGRGRYFTTPLSVTVSLHLSVLCKKTLLCSPPCIMHATLRKIPISFLARRSVFASRRLFMLQGVVSENLKDCIREGSKGGRH